MIELLNLSSGVLPVVRQHARPTGFVEGTLFQTDEGERPVEQLLAGDKVMTADAGLCELRGTSVMVAQGIDLITFHRPGDEGGAPLLVLPAMQQVMVADWRASALFECESIFTPAGSLVDGLRITRETQPLLRLFRLHFDAPHELICGGFVVASEKTRAPLPFGLNDDDAFYDEDAAPPPRRQKIH